MSSQYRPNVAIAGSTGYLGSQVLSVLTSPTLRPSFNQVVVLKRKKSQSPTTAAQPQDQTEQSIPQDDQQITTRYYNESDLSASLTNINVLINTIGPSGHVFKDNLLRAIPSIPTLKLYLPSEFGCDHTTHDFPHEEWDHKKAHFDLATQILKDTDVRVCRIFIGLFIEASIGPWFGFDTKNARYESVGPPDVPVSYTSLEDTGRVIAAVARMDPKQVPDRLHVSSETLTTRELAAIMEGAGSTPITITEVNLDGYKAAVIREETADPSKYLRFLMAEGKLDHRVSALGNDDEFVNPGESVWKWNTMREYANGVNGRPWADYEWSADSIK